MNKNLIVVAITAAMIAPATAMAGATFYGHAQVEVGSYSHENDFVAGNSGDKKPTLSVADNARGRIGMKAVEDLGNGWKGLAVFEFRADTAAGNVKDGRALTAREQMVGLKGGAGTFELGRLKTAYKYTGGVKYDAFVTTLLEARGNGGMLKNKAGFASYGASSFQSNAFAYRNKWGGFKLNLTYGPETDDSSYTYAFSYGNKGWEVFVSGFDTSDLAERTTGDIGAKYSAVKVGGKFKLGANSFFLQYEDIADRAITGIADPTTGFENKPKFLYLAYQLKMGKNVFVANYGDYDSDKAKAGNISKDSTYYAIGVIHNFTKQTRIYGGYRDTSTDYKGGESVISFGIRKTFKGGS